MLNHQFLSSLADVKMKFFVSFVILLLCIVSTLQLQMFENCPPGHPALMRQDELICARTTCRPDGSSLSVGCGQYTCMKQKGYKEDDNTKLYPECCGGPICDTEETVVIATET